MGAFIEANKAALKKLDEVEDENVALAIMNPLTEWNAWVGRLGGVMKTVVEFTVDTAESCRWVELTRRRGESEEVQAKLCLAPVDVREVLKETLHDRMKTEIMASATLTVQSRISASTSFARSTSDSCHPR